MKNLIDGIFLDSFEISIPYSFGRQDIISTLAPLGEYSISDENLSVSSRLFHGEELFLVVFSFEGELLNHISISPLQGSSDPKKRYRKVQKELSNLLGPCINLVRIVLNALYDDYKKHVWKLDGIRIEHRLWERFGFCEEISISLSRS